MGQDTNHKPPVLMVCQSPSAQEACAGLSTSLHKPPVLMVTETSSGCHGITQAAQQLKARVFKTNKTLSTLSPASPNAAGRKSFAQARPAPMATDGSAAALPGKLEAAATTLREQQEKLLQAQNGGDPGSLPKRLRYVSCDSVPVLYKQWHPAVSVLFADISSYTAMSQQVEPEQVGLRGKVWFRGVASSVQECTLRQRAPVVLCKHVHALQCVVIGT
jgi:hypothetical protein